MITLLVTVATVARGADGLVVRVIDPQKEQGLEQLKGLRAWYCNKLQRRMGGTDVTVPAR